LIDHDEAAHEAKQTWGFAPVASCTFTALATSLLLLAMSHAAPNGDDLYYGAVLVVVAVIVFGIAAFLRMGLAPLVVAVFCIVILVAGYATEAPLELRWKLSESDFNRWVAEGHGQVDISKPFRLGLFSVERVDSNPDGYLFYDGTSDLSDTGDGIAYLPHGIPVGLAYAEDVFTHLDGPWYSWVGYS
jgi:hypothetical protein